MTLSREELEMWRERVLHYVGRTNPFAAKDRDEVNAIFDAALRETIKVMSNV